MMSRRGITVRSREAEFLKILRYMMWLHASWQTPTVREIGELMNWTSSSTAWVHLQKMQHAGLIEQVPHSPRSMRLTKKGADYVADHGGMNSVDFDAEVSR